MANAGGHRIVELACDDDHGEGDAWWACSCGEVADGYTGIQQARLPAAEHQLPPDVQRAIEDAIPHTDVDRWRDVVRWLADQAAAADPLAWAWYLNTAGTTRKDH